MKNKILLF